MDTTEMVELILDFLENDPGNRISAEIAKSPEYEGKRIFKNVICGVALSDDPDIVSLKNNKDANIDLMQPGEWLPGARSVISFFMPFEDFIVKENTGGDRPSGSWLHGRIEGQAAINQITNKLIKRIQDEGNDAVAPVLDPRFKAYTRSSAGIPEYTSNWSERHIAYAAGLGTFGLSGGLITSLGTAGRFTSIITNLSLDPTPRNFKRQQEYCQGCGACILACPVYAISAEQKDNSACDSWLEKIKEQEAPYYGCGKCQCGMPCEKSMPGKK